MKKTFLILLVSIISFSGFCQNQNKLEIEEIISALNLYINSSVEKEPIIPERMNLFNKKLKNENIKLIYDNTLDYGISGCTGLIFEEDSSIQLLYGDFLLDVYKTNPITAYSILIFNIQSIYDSYNNPILFRISFNNPIEKLFFQADALSIEILFLDKYVKNKSVFKAYEGYVFNSFQGAMSVFYEGNLNLAHQIDDLSKVKNSSSEKQVELLTQLGIELFEQSQIKTKELNWPNYTKYVDLNTYHNLATQALYDIILIDKPKLKANEFNAYDYPEFIKINKQIKEHIDSNKNLLSYRRYIIESFNKEYTQ